MRKTLVTFLLLTFSVLVFSQQKALSVLGKKVPLYSAPDFAAPVLDYLHWNTAVVGMWENGWYTVNLPDGKVGYLSKWDAMESEILNDPVQAKRIAPSAETLYRMMKFFKRQDKLARAEDFALRIINDFKDEEYPTKDGCFKIAHLSYMYMISDPEAGVNYDAYLAAFSRRVIDEAHNPAVQAMATYHLARYESLNGAQDRALALLFTVVERFPEQSSRNECKLENADTWFYIPRRSKQLFLAIAMIQPERELEGLRSRLDALAAGGSSEATRAMARELREHLGTMPYERDQSIWY